MWFWMYVRLVKVISILFLIVVLPVKLTSTESRNVINQVTTSIDMSTQLVNVQYKIYLVSGNNYLRSFNFIIDPSFVDNLSYITATGKNIEPNIPLVDRGNGHWEIFFENPLRKGQRENILIHAIFTHVLRPYPTQIKQNENHLVLYSGPLSCTLPYLSLNHTSYITLGKGFVESVTKTHDFELLATSPLTFSSIAPQKPNTKAFTKIHFEHSAPFLTVRKLNRQIEISHWGSINVIEEIFLENTGAKLYGPYHRQLYNDKGNNKIVFFTTALPASATDILVYDEIGLVSSVTTTMKEDYVEMELHPRFLLYGGWKIKYFVSYNVPLYEYLFNDGNKYILKMRVIDHIFDDMVIDTAVIKIILPEGTEQFSLETPYSVTLLNETYHSSYLDTMGKPVLAFTKTNMVEQHIQDFVLQYKFAKFKMLYEPLYIIAFIELIFIVIILFLRTDFTISKDIGQHENKTISETTALVKQLHVGKIKKKRY